MIAGIEGKLRSKDHDSVTVDVGGIVLRIRVPASAFANLGSPGARVYLHTSLHIRDDDLILYGFTSVEELQAFELLNGVSGIGPRVALALLSSLSPEKLAIAVNSGDETLLNSIPGVGKKTAGRIILELKSKLGEPGKAVPRSQEDVRTALMSLGYTISEATAAVSALPDDESLSLEDRITKALRYLASVS